MKRSLWVLFIALISCSQKESYRFSVDKGTVQATPISLVIAQLDEIGIGLDDDVKLLNKEKVIPFQIDSDQKRLWFVHSPEHDVFYTFEKGGEVNQNPITRMEVVKNDGDLDISRDSKPLLTYRYGMTYPPEGVDTIFKKSGYIHPVRSPSGDTLSRIQPPDHYHHYGIWGPWTHTQIKGERIDFWNLAEGQGTVLFEEFEKTISGDIFSGFSARQNHLNLTAAPTERIALNEDLEVRAWDLGRPDRYMFDYTTTFSTPLDSGILFEAYRYGGGLGMRFTERWRKENCSVLTSEGKDRLTADGSSARWCIVSGESSDGMGTNGILFMSHPDNRSHPEPMRIWPIDGNGGRGDMFFEFCPIRHEEWHIAPNQDYQLKYRMVVFEGKLSAEEAEAYWQTFASEPEIQILK